MTRVITNIIRFQTGLLIRIFALNQFACEQLQWFWNCTNIKMYSSLLVSFCIFLSKLCFFVSDGFAFIALKMPIAMTLFLWATELPKFSFLRIFLNHFRLALLENVIHFKI